MHSYRLTIEYEGTRFHGWQEQQNARTLAGELRKAVEQAGAKVADLGGAGRTDAGVHALAQVAHLRIDRPVDCLQFRRKVNEGLPPDIHVLSLIEARLGFHARHDARARSYLYQICRRRTAFAKRFVWWVRPSLDFGRMAAAAAQLPGDHDFALFCEKPGAQSSTRVVVEDARLVEAGDLVLVRLVASHFLWKMVRRVVGALVKVGTGELELEGFERLVEATPLPAGEPGPAQWTASPSGLFLERVLYPGEPPLPALAPAVPVPAAELETGRLFAGARTGSPRRPSRRKADRSK